MKQGVGIDNEDENAITMQIGTKAGTRVRKKMLENCRAIGCVRGMLDLKRNVFTTERCEDTHKRVGERGNQHDETCSRQQVRWGYKWHVQGYTGPNAAQLDHPQGSTRTFRHKAGVSWVLGLRHGVTMHTRGRLTTWGSYTSKTQHAEVNNKHNTTITTHRIDAEKCRCRNCREMPRIITQFGNKRSMYYSGGRTCYWDDRQSRNTRDQVSNSAANTKIEISLARRQSEELYRNDNFDNFGTW